MTNLPKFNSKKDIKNFIQEKYKNDPTKMALAIYELRKIGMIIATLYGQSFRVNDMHIIDDKILELQNKVSDDPEHNNKLKEKLIDRLKELSKQNKTNQLLLATDIGAGRGYDNVANLVGFRGHFVNAKNEFVDIPIKDSLLDGVDQKEFYAYGNAARKGIMDRVMMTSKPGYFMRQSIYALDVQIDPDNICNPKNRLKIIINDKNKDKLIDRFIYINGKDILLTEENIKDYIGKKVELYTPIYCTMPKNKICRRCAGLAFEKWNSKELGILAATSVSEQLYTKLLKSFHTGATGKIIKPKTDQIKWNREIKK